MKINLWVFLKNYMKTEASLCFTNFTYEEPIIVGATDSIDVEIKKENVFVTIQKPITISIDDSETTISKHQARVESNLLTFAQTAEKIVTAESQTYFLENRTLDILSVYDEIPFEGIEFSCGTLTWSAIEVEEALKEAIQANTEQIKLKKANSQKSYYIWDVGLEREQEDIGTYLSYNTRDPILLEISPSSGDILKSESTRGGGVLGSLACVNNYKFVYTIQYPALVRLEKDGEIFQFGMDVRIVGNHADEITEPLSVGGGNNQICGFAPKKIELQIIDSKTLEVVEPTSVQLRCGASACQIKDNNFPQCVGGTLLVETDGYMPYKQSGISTLEEEPLIISMKRVHTIPVEVQAYTTSGPRTLNQDESAIITFTGDEYSTTLNYPEQKEINLGEGDYEIVGNLILEGERTILGGRSESCLKVPRESILGLVGLKKEECVTAEVDDMVLDSLIVGQSSLTTSFPDFELSGAKKMVIYLDHTGIPRNFEEMQDQETVVMSKAPEVIR